MTFTLLALVVLFVVLAVRYDEKCPGECQTRQLREMEAEHRREVYGAE